MRARGIDLAGRRSKHLAEFTGQRFDYVISLCDRVREVCPEFPGRRGRSTGASATRRASREPTTRRCPPSSARPPSSRLRIGFLLAAIDQTNGNEEVTTMPDELVSVRYMVDDVETAIAFYTTHFGFELRTSAAPAFADVVRGHLRLLLSGPRARPEDRCPTAGHPSRAAGTAST